METSTIAIYKKLEQSGVKFVDYAYLTLLTGVTNQNTLYKIVTRLIEKNILQTLIDGKYQVTNTIATDFEIANYIYNPSYISLESALSYYGILAQFPYTTTSITTKKSNVYKISSKEYKFSQIKKDFFNEYKMIDGFLIATAEKAVFDLIYFSIKGVVKIDFSDLDLSSVDMKKLKSIIVASDDERMINKFTKINNDR